MAYVEIWRNGKLVTSRRVDEKKAKAGCKIRLGSQGEIRLSAGQSKTLGEFEMCMLEGEPPGAEPNQAGAQPPAHDEQANHPLLDFSADARNVGAGKMDGIPEIEGYRITERLGSGGMGTVWRAEQLSTHRQVALKLMACHSARPEQAEARFEREVELTARLDHPNIARIYDSGLHHGVYYYAMELIDGMPLDRYVHSIELPQNQILELMRKICQAVLYAHLRAVIHRDLKPSNILVDADGQPHVLDFGLAKALLEEDGGVTVSIEGQITGTPAYMSPEQASGHHDQIDTRTDVFSLGVILYELLTGRPPHDRSGSMIDLLRQIAEGNVQRPRTVAKSMDAELETILLKALARDPEDRYASAGALGKDIANYLNNEPLDARVPTTLYFLRKKVRKYRPQVIASAAVLTVVFVTIIIAYTRVVAERAVRRAQQMELDLKSQKLTWAELELKVLSGDRKEARAALGILRDEYIAAQNEIGDLNFKLGERKSPVAVRRLDLSSGPALASTALVRTPSLPGRVESWTIELYGHRGQISKLAFSPDGSRLASSGFDGTIRVCDGSSGALMDVLVEPNASTLDLIWSRDSRSLRVSCPTDTAEPFVWVIEEGKIAKGQTLPDYTWDETAGTLWSAGRQNSGRALDEVAQLLGVDLPLGWRASRRSITALALGPRHNMLALGDRNGTIRVIDAQSGRLAYTYMGVGCGPVQTIRLSSDDKILAISTGLGTISLWDIGNWTPLRRFQTNDIKDGSASVLSSMAWAPNGAAIARARVKEGHIEILDSQSGELLRTLFGVSHDISSVSWSADGTFIAATTEGGPAYLWDMARDSNEPATTLTARSDLIDAMVWMPNDDNLITVGDDGHITVWNARTGVRIRSIQSHATRTASLAFSPETGFLASGSYDGTICLWDTKDDWTSLSLSDPLRDSREASPNLSALAWSPDGKWLASGDSAGTIRIWNAELRRLERAFGADCLSVNSLLWSPDGRILLCGGGDGTVRGWDVSCAYQEHIVLLPLWGEVGPGIAFNAAGDYRSPPGVEDQLVHVIRTMDSHSMLSPADFKSQYGWVNEPWQVGLYQPGEETLSRIYVNVDSTGPHDGETWGTAFADLQNALSIAQPNTEIWVAAGTYTPDRGTGARRASFHLKNGVRLLGGFSGMETSSYQRDPNGNRCILSGDLRGNDGPSFANNDENSYHVVTALGIDPNAGLDGFTITGGSASGPKNGEHRSGGGMYMRTSSPSVMNCVFEHNSAMYYGGGMLMRDDSHPKLTKCEFRGNSAGAGGGASMVPHCSPVFLACRFVGNTALGRTVAGRPAVYPNGGGIFNDHSTSTLVNCTFTDNEAAAGGGMYHSSRLSAKLTGCTFSGNRADQGGGLCIAYDGRPVVVDSEFVGNSADGGGGVANINRSNSIVINCKFNRNSANIGGGFENDGGGGPVLVGCVFGGNSASTRGAGMMCAGGFVEHDSGRLVCSTPTLVNCTFIANKADIDGGGIFNEKDSKTRLVNCILWGNRDRGGIDASAQIDVTQTNQPTTIDFCCIQFWMRQFGGNENVGADPLFADPNGPDGLIGTMDDDLHLSPRSPCVDAGNNAALPADISDLDTDGNSDEPIPMDITGRARILNGTVDMGAYESD